jgi:uncharacterized membrane protein
MGHKKDGTTIQPFPQKINVFYITRIFGLLVLETMSQSFTRQNVSQNRRSKNNYTGYTFGCILKARLSVYLAVPGYRL